MKSASHVQFDSITAALNLHVPKAAASYCLELWLHYPFTLKITRKRKTKQGDYRYNSVQKSHLISINSNLNPYSFLITYIHEIAHLDAFQQFGYHITPHGSEWKSSFRQLMSPVLTGAVFPKRVLEALECYMANPKASTCSDQMLTLALQEHDCKEGLINLADLQLNHAFRFNRRVFLKKEVKRTRAWCKELQTGKYYTVAESALVEVVQEEAESLRVMSELTSSTN